MLWVLIRIASPSQSNEHPQHMFFRITKIIRKVSSNPPYLFHCYEHILTSILTCFLSILSSSCLYFTGYRSISSG